MNYQNATVNKKQVLRDLARDMRKNPTLAEKILWRELRNRNLGGFKFRRQHVIYPFIVDFYCAKVKLVIELDGGIHKTQKDYDQARSQYLEERGIRVIRFRNEEIFEHSSGVLSNILKACETNEG